MSDAIAAVARTYEAILRDYLDGGSEAALVRAYDVGREAIGHGLGLLDLAEVHQRAEASAVDGGLARDEADRRHRLAATFFAECLGPFEMAMRGFREANAALQARSETLEQHMATVSHELRTPLTMIRGFSELLAAGRLAPAQHDEAIAQICVSSERLSRLIDDLLSVSRIESGRLIARTEPLDVDGVIDEAIAASATQSPVTIELQEGLPRIVADRDMLVQILTNLISNASKYSPDAGTIHVRGRSVGPSIELAVEDNGMGMTVEECRSIFGKFVRLDRDEDRAVQGTGLGLYITKELVERQAGHISVRSEPGRGSTFTVLLPAEPASTAVAGRAS